MFRIAEEMSTEPALREGLERMLVASIGPTTSESLEDHGISPDLEPSHPKMGLLVKEAADQWRDLLSRKRGGRG